MTKHPGRRPRNLPPSISTRTGSRPLEGTSVVLTGGALPKNVFWQVAGLAYLMHIGSPQSKEGDERKEEKIDRILTAVAKDADRIIRELDEKYPRK